MHVMDYSLLLGIHDVKRAEREEEGEGEGEVVEEEEGYSAEEEEEDEDQQQEEEEEEQENGVAPAPAPAPAVGSFGTSPGGIAGYPSSFKPLGPGEYDPYVDVYAVQSTAGGSW